MIICSRLKELVMTVESLRKENENLKEEMTGKRKEIC